jgi:ssDNA-binding Zn-finger/Zn-ribbon topoisomerase 1
MSDAKSWYETGYAGAEREAEKSELGYPPQRLWLKPGSSMEGVFIDDEPFACWEHGYKVGPGKYDHVTCIVKIDEQGCPGCESGGVQKADFTGHLTFVDCSGYQDKKGVWHKFRLTMLTPKTKVMNKMKNKKESRGSLINHLVNITRTDENSPNTGDDFDFLREANAEEMFKVVTYKGKKIAELIEKANGGGAEAAKTRKYLDHHFRIPEGDIPMEVPVFNYPNLLQPLDYAGMKAKIARAQGFEAGTPAGNSAAPGGEAKSDDIPF